MWSVDPSGLLCANYMIWMVNWANLILASGNDSVYKFSEWHLYESGFNFYCIEYTYYRYFNILLELFTLRETLLENLKSLEIGWFSFYLILNDGCN